MREIQWAQVTVSKQYREHVFRKPPSTIQREFRPMAEVPFRPVRQLSEYKGKAASASREAARANCYENHFVEKTNQYHTCCFGILHGAICHICPLGVHLAE